MDSAAQSAGIRPPTWYWVVSGIALAWMLIGVMSWVMDLLTDEAALAQMSEAQQQLYRARPSWIFVLYAIAIFGGLAGAIGLLMRKRWSVTALAVSLVAVIVQFGYVLGVMDAIRLLGFAGAAAFPIVIFLIGAALLWFASHAKKSGWFTA
ncbi:MAG TPA: hypothetical protein PKE27_03080 [Povalibacter sp.]|uniref:hypothetical protein n=1 Tax=Povalibacter sp. TaxID=1962978 RepID=UPI002BC43835|nr:hypothetical protein [Povalibacter sp.]HMN43525.1 hypothetical protein [Povalibacter sp.]